MKTKIWRLHEDSLEMDYQEAVELLKKGEVVAFPTETVYGLGANGLDSAAVAKIFIAKKRPADNPLILHIADKEDIYALVSSVNSTAQALIDHFWPGPLTLVLPKAAGISKLVTAGLDTVAVRMPSNLIARNLIRLANLPIAAPSANISTKPSPTTAFDVLEDMNGSIAGVIDGGGTIIGVESTVIDCTSKVAKILRPGKIGIGELEEILGVVDVDCGTIFNNNTVPCSPGMKYKHYAPKAKMQTFIGKNFLENFTQALNNALKENLEVGILTSEETLKGISENIFVKTWGKRSDKNSLAKNLYSYLREFDRQKVDIILAEGVDEQGIGLAIMNRMIKASAHNVVE